MELIKLEEGYHWFRQNADGTAFIAYHEEDGDWFMCGIGSPISVALLDSSATYLRPVEKAPHH